MKEKILKSYKFELVRSKEGKEILQRTNDGWTALELLGITALIQTEISALFGNNVKIDEIQRIVKEKLK